MARRTLGVKFTSANLVIEARIARRKKQRGL
jgi:hypothetical protein